jgi:hypothetical protein
MVSGPAPPAQNCAIAMRQTRNGRQLAMFLADGLVPVRRVRNPKEPQRIEQAKSNYSLPGAWNRGSPFVVDLA